MEKNFKEPPSAATNRPLVVHLIDDLNACGGAQRILVAALEHKGCSSEHEVIFLNITQSYLHDRVKRLGIKCRCLSFFRLYQELKKMKERRPVFIHAHLNRAILFAAILPSTASIATIHSVIDRQGVYCNIKAKMLDCALSRFDRVVAISYAVYQSFPVSLIGTEKAKVIYNGLANVSLSTGANRKSKAGIQRIGMVARFRYPKDQLTLIRSLLSLPGTVVLHLVGDGEIREYCENYVASLGLSDRVVFWGQVDEPSHIIESLQVYIQSSTHEGFGLAPLEAMCYGIPTIGSDVDGLRELIPEPQLRFKAGDHHQLASAILNLLLNPSHKAFAVRCAEEQCRKFSVKKMVKTYLCQYNEIGGDSR